ncbi:MAG: MMPL family transporter [Phycisphaera sp.]|nr:MMPL family transporter [Phycisphaera sp.]
MNFHPARSVIRFSLDHPNVITALMLGSTLVLLALAAIPTVLQHPVGPLPPARIDTDPENMLPHDEPHRVYHDRMKRNFSMWDMVVVGVVNDKNPQGVFNPDSLLRIRQLTDYAKTLTWPDPGFPDDPTKRRGVIEPDIIAPSVVDNIQQGRQGEVVFSWLMPRVPVSNTQAGEVRDAALKIPFLKGTLVSEDGKAIAIYLPITSKDMSYEIRQKLLEKIATFGSVDDEFHITGLPVAEDTFGVEMFYQMAISAPLAMGVIFLLMWFFFKKLSLIVPPMVIAMVCAVGTMALLVITGNTIHIMSSMIPIFIMPIAVLDAIHILSDFFDRYRQLRERRKTIEHVMDTLFMPMLFTSLTTVAGFASLALTPIPPVQVFGIFVGIGVSLAWIWTITFIPAAVMLIPERWLASLATGAQAHTHDEAHGWLGRVLPVVGQMTHRYAKAILVLTVLVSLVSEYGMSRITINDNPTKWFTDSHPIRVADRVLNEHFGGTYMAFLTLAPKAEAETPTPHTKADLPPVIDPPSASGDALPDLPAGLGGDGPALPEGLGGDAVMQMPTPTPNTFTVADEPFKQPEVLRYIADLQQYLLTVTDGRGDKLVGKSNSVTDLVKTVHRELLSGTQADFRVPDSANGVADTLLQFQNSHRPQDLWHFITPDHREASLWLQLRSGDNRDMSRVVHAVDRYIQGHPLPAGLEHKWFGLTYINVIWQERMVSGMLQAFLGSFLVVLLMMIFLFRSGLWGLLSMIPLTVTVGLIYGLIGLVGKDYDMPIAVLSSLSLGLAVDYAIHFLARSREAYREHGSWAGAVGPMFGEPARAITRNAIVVGVGFLPLLAAPLVPYKTVGLFIALILLTAGFASLLILPALLTVLEKWLFPSTAAKSMTCRCGTCVLSALAAVALVAINVHQFLDIGWTHMTWASLGAVVVLLGLCWASSRRASCKTPDTAEQTDQHTQGASS